MWKKYGIVYKNKVCQRCGKEFEPKSSSQKYCDECRKKAKKLATCPSWHDPDENKEIRNMVKEASEHHMSYAKWVVYCEQRENSET